VDVELTLDEVDEDVKSCHVMAVCFFVALSIFGLSGSLTKLSHLLSIRRQIAHIYLFLVIIN